MNERLLTMPEVSELLRAPIDTLRYWRTTGTGPQGFKIGRRVVYRESEVLRFINEQAERAS